MTSSMSYEPESLIYTEVADEFPEPTQEEIEEYAKRIGIDVTNESNLLYLAREGIQAKLPPSWSPCLDTTKNSFYYFNKETLESQWEHPMDPLYREKVIRARGDLSMNRPLSLQPLNMRLPPVRKSGASLAPINRGVGSLGGLGSLGPAAGDFRSAQARQESASSNNKANFLNRHNDASSKDIISSSSLHSFKDTTDDEEDDTPPVMRPQRKLGLTLTGGGAKFMKGSGPAVGESEESQAKLKRPRGFREVTPDSDDVGGGGDSDKRPIKKEEKMVVSQLDSLSTSKSKGNNVKFNLDENTELKFEMPEDDVDDLDASKKAEEHGKEEPEDDDDEASDTEEDETTQSSKPSTREQTSRKSVDADEKSADDSVASNKERIPNANNNKNYPIPFTSEYSETDIEAMKVAMREEMEAELKKFRDQLEDERKSRQEQIQKHLEETVAQFKLEKDETLRKMRKDMENEKAFEVDRTKRDIDSLLQRELKEMKSKFSDALQKRQKELEAENEKKIEALTLEYRKREEDKLSEVMERHSSEEMLRMTDDSFKRQRENLEEEHKQQIVQLKEYHQAFLDKVKADLQEEEEKLRQDHIVKRAEIVSQFERETEDLKMKLVRSQEEALNKIQKEFNIKRASLEKSVNASLQDVKNLIQQRNSKRSASDTSLAGKTPDDELRSMKVKYQQLERKYQSMKKELEQLTEDVAERKQQPSPVKTLNNENNKKNEGPVTPNKQSLRLSPMKAVGLRNLKDRRKSLDGSDSAHGSESNTDTNSSVYPSSEGIVAPPKLQKSNTVDDPVEELAEESQSIRINAALQSLEILKKEILDLKQSRSKTPVVGGAKVTEKPPSGVAVANNLMPNKHLPMSARKASSKPEGSLSARQRSTTVPLSSKGSKSARTKDLSGSNNSESISEDAHQRIVDAAKAFIRMQKNRLKDPSPIPNSSHLILPTTKNNLLLFDDKLLKSVSPRRPASIHLDHVSETESSGVSSLKDHRSTESKKLSRDIGEICDSLNSLDQQMKFMWSVVKGKQEGYLQDESLAYLNPISTTELTSYLPNTVPMILGKSARLSTSSPTSARKLVLPHTSVQLHNGLSPTSGTNGRNYSSLLSASQNSKSQTVLDALRMSGMSTTRLDCSDLLQSLEEELKEFKSTKQRLLDLQRGPFGPSRQEKTHHLTTTTSSIKSNNNHSSTILEKTKDLQEWLKKY